MLYLHDVWANWSEEDNFYLIPDFHEWRKEETIELIDDAPLIKVNAGLFNKIAFGNEKLDEIGNRVYRKGSLRKNHERIVMDYMFIVSDGERVLSVKLDRDKCVTHRSHLYTRNYQLAIEMVKDSLNDFELDSVDLDVDKSNLGLTRKERDMKREIEMYIDGMSESDLPKLKYLIAEIDCNTYRTIKSNDLKSCLNAFKNIPVSKFKIKEGQTLSETLNKLTGVTA